MAIALLILRLVPMIVALVDQAEKLFKDEPKSGEQKRKFVLDTIRILIGGASAVFTGGALDTWKLLEFPITLLVDYSAALQFPHIGEFTETKGIKP